VVDGARSRHRCAIGCFVGSESHEGAVQMQISTIGLDIAKNAARPKSPRTSSGTLATVKVVVRSAAGTLCTQKPFSATHVLQPKAGKSMKHPTPSDFIVKVNESYVNVIFKPTDSDYNFGRLADPEDIARYGPLSRSPNVRHGNTGDTGDYPPEDVAQMAHSLAVKAITSP